MTKQSWYILIEDIDKGIYASVGPFQYGDDDSDWIKNIDSARQTGRDIRWQYFESEQLNEIAGHALERQLIKGAAEDIIEVPIDRSNEYQGKLPQYAANANRKKLIKVFCKGRCRKTMWAELNVDYPGKEVIRQAEMYVYKATCLRCGKVAYDNYNWLCR